MRVYIDDEPFESGLEPGASVADLLDEVRAAVSSPQRLVMGLRTDGLEVSGEEFQQTMQQPAQDFSRYDLTTADPRQVVVEAMNDCVALLASAERERASVIEALTQGDTGVGMTALGTCCRSWQRVHGAILEALALLQLDPSEVRVEGEALTDLLSGAIEQLGQIREALQARDFVLISDILQYEFDVIVKHWQAAIRTVQGSAAAPA